MSPTTWNAVAAPRPHEQHRMDIDLILGGYRCSCGRWRYTHVRAGDPDGVARRMHESHCEDPDAG